MSSYILRRLSARPSSTFLLSLPRTLQPATQTPRFYAITTKGDAPNASNVTNPQSSSAEESGVNNSRATDSMPNKDSASVQSPVSGENLQNKGDESPDNDLVKQDKDKPTAEKKKQVESLGEKPLGPEDHQ